MELDVLLEILEHASDLPVPARATSGSSGVDLKAAVEFDILVRPGKTELIPTGLKVSIPAGYEWQIRPRSGNALKYGITVLNSPGTIDSDYRGEVKVILANLGEKPFRIQRGDRIAQAVLAPVVYPRFKIVENVPETHRGEGGFGHSGV
ncbi:MAG: dUTP diphosphatase [Candidatus Aegiribacteria sp.]|nr:dUTP diphosphatase [Candidatus Aegiribacteria sp.]